MLPFVFAVVVIPSFSVLSGYFSLFEMSFNTDIPQFGCHKFERVFPMRSSIFNLEVTATMPLSIK